MAVSIEKKESKKAFQQITMYLNWAIWTILKDKGYAMEKEHHKQPTERGY